MFAVVKASGFQRLVEVGSVISIDPTNVDSGGFVHFPVLLLVDGAEVVSDPDKLQLARVSAKFLRKLRGPKVRIHKFKNKTGYHKRQGHRQGVYVFSVTSIERGD